MSMRSSTASGRFVLRLSPELHSRLKREGARKALSLNQICTRFILSGLNQSSGADARSLFLSEELQKTMRKEWKKDLLGIVLFGSNARGDAQENSDVDILLVLRPEASIQRALYRKWDQLFSSVSGMDRFSPQFVSLPSSKTEAGSLWFEIALDGKIIWECEEQLSLFLRGLRADMAEGKLRRKLTHGHPYWERVETSKYEK